MWCDLLLYFLLMCCLNPFCDGFWYFLLFSFYPSLSLMTFLAYLVIYSVGCSVFILYSTLVLVSFHLLWLIWFLFHYVHFLQGFQILILNCYFCIFGHLYEGIVCLTLFIDIFSWFVGDVLVWSFWWLFQSSSLVSYWLLVWSLCTCFAFLISVKTLFTSLSQRNHQPYMELRNCLCLDGLHYMYWFWMCRRQHQVHFPDVYPLSSFQVLWLAIAGVISL